MEMVPGILPLISSWLGDVTSASATSALVSDTRAIGVPTSSTVERPTSRRTELGSASTAATAVLGAATALAESTGDWAQTIDPVWARATSRIPAPVQTNL